MTTLRRPLYVLLAITFTACVPDPEDASISADLTGDRVVAASVKTLSPSFGGGVKPGDTLTLAGGPRGGLTITGLKGTASAPIVIRNDPASANRVEIDVAGTTFGVSFVDCEYVVFDGSANPSFPFGIWVRTSRDDAHTLIKVRGLSQHVTLRYLEVDGRNDVTQPGIGIDTNDHTISIDDHPGFYIDGHVIEHNWVHDTRTEAMYLGSNNLDGREPRVRNIEVHHNLVENAGWDCINLKNATEGDNLIHHNVCRRGGSDRGEPDQITSVTLQDSTARVYNNLILESGGHAFATLHPQYTGLVEVFNNVIVRPGRDGIAEKRSGLKFNDDSIIEAYHNTIVGTPEAAVRSSSSARGKVHDNLIAGCAAGLDRGGVTDLNNLVTTLAAAGFVGADKDDYDILPSSPAHDTAAASALATDYLDRPRPRDKAADRGAYEVQPAQARGLSESFTDATGTPVSVHDAEIVTEAGAATIDGNALRFDRDNTILSFRSGGADVKNEIAWITGGAAALDRNSLIVRMKDASNFIACNVRKPQQDVRILRVVDGMWTQIARAQMTVASQRAYQLTCVAQGDLLRFLVDGQERLSVRDAAFVGEVRQGVMRNAGSGVTRVDDWKLSSP